MFSMLKRTFLIFLIFFGATSQASIPKSFFRSTMQPVVSFATNHPWWTAYGSIGLIIGATLGTVHIIDSHDLKELAELNKTLLEKYHNKEKIICSLWSSSVWSQEVKRAIEDYNKTKNQSDFAKMQEKIEVALREINAKNENEKSYKSTVIIPYLVLGAIGAGIGWFWGKK
jgi:hypothetical protein